MDIKFLKKIKECKTNQDYLNLLDSKLTIERLGLIFNHVIKNRANNAELLNKFSTSVSKHFIHKIRFTTSHNFYAYSGKINGVESKMLLETKNFINSDDGKDLVRVIIDKRFGDKQLYPYVVKDLVNFSCYFIDNENNARFVLNNFYKKLNEDNKNKLVNLLPDKENDRDYLKLVNKSSDILKRFSKESLNDPTQRGQLIKLLTDKPSYMSKIDFDIKITLEDLKQLPPVSRFNFIKLLYLPFFSCVAKPNYISENEKHKINYWVWYLVYGNATQQWRSKISIDSISVEDIELLLFSVTLKKNEEMSNWFNCFKEIKQMTILKSYLNNLSNML